MSNDPTSYPPLIDTKRAAEVSGLDTNLLVALRKSEKGPKCIKIGRQYLYDENTVLAWRKSLAL